MARRRKPNWTGSKEWMAREGLIFTLPANVILFLSSLSPCAWPHTSSPCLGRSGGCGEETPGNKTMEGPCQLSAFAWSLLPSRYITSGWIISIPAGGDSSTNLLTLSFFCANTVMERTRSWDSVHVIKTDPRAKQSRLYISSYFQKDLGCIYLPLKRRCHLLLERCITGAKDANPEANIQWGGEKKNCRHTRPHIHFYFPINSCPARQKFHISCRDTETNSKLKFIFCVEAISVPVLSSPAVFHTPILKVALLTMENSSWGGI